MAERGAVEADIGLPKTKAGRLLEELLLKRGDMALRSKVARNVFALGDKLRKLKDIKDVHFRVELVVILRDRAIARAREATSGLAGGDRGLGAVDCETVDRDGKSIPTLVENVLRTMAKESVRAAGVNGKRGSNPRHEDDY